MRLQQQARLQAKTMKTRKLTYELLPVDSTDPKGLASLPDHNDSDLFFELEGYPLDEGGLKYLWGCSYSYNVPRPRSHKGPNQIGYWDALTN
jgi:uncharacterized protein